MVLPFVFVLKGPHDFSYYNGFRAEQNLEYKIKKEIRIVWGENLFRNHFNPK